MPARWSRTHSSAKILSMKRSSRVPFVSQCTTSPSECAVTGSIFGGAFISCSWDVTWTVQDMSCPRSTASTVGCLCVSFRPARCRPNVHNESFDIALDFRAGGNHLECYKFAEIGLSRIIRQEDATMPGRHQTGVVDRLRRARM